MNEMKHTQPALKQSVDNDSIKDYWTEHRITLIAFQTQYVYQRRPNRSKPQQLEPKGRSNKLNKKEIEYQGGFLFPGRTEEKLNQMNVYAEIMKSQCNYLKDLFNNDYKISQDLLELRQFIKIMLQLKHFSVFFQFMDLYDFILREIRDVKFQTIRLQQSRINVIDRIAEKLVKLVDSKSQVFKVLNGYLKDGRKQTSKLFKVTIYCFLAEKHNFNINEYYAEAFQVMEEQKKVPKKKVKLND